VHIFIDESGSFTQSATKPGLSVVASLVIPDHRLAHVERKYKQLRVGFPKHGTEVKGRLLDEQQIPKLVELLRKNEALLQVVAIDLNTHSEAELGEHKRRQGEGMTVNLTDKHHPNIHKVAGELRSQVENMSNQLYVQSAVTFELIWLTTEHAINYFAQRQPKELAEFHWVVDAKGDSGPTNWEEWWTKVVMPILQSKSTREPHGLFELGDFTYFKRFFGEVPDYLPRPEGKPDLREGTNIRLLLMEHFRFSTDSEPGLEMVDILANAVRRALIGNLGFAGWKDIPRLMMHRNRHYISLLALHDHPAPRKVAYARVVNHFRRGGRTMLAPRFQRE
jgi:hypothetical protein